MKENKEAERDLEASANVDAILEIFRTHSVDAARLGFNVLVLPEDEWLHVVKHLSGNPKEQVSYSEAEVRELLKLQRRICAKFARGVEDEGGFTISRGAIIHAPEPQLKSSIK
jgi:hypothetical protein